MITSRGCPFRCSFCDKTVSGSSWRARTAVDVVDEMQEMVEEYGIEFINIYDDNFTLHRQRVIDICQEIIRRGLLVHWKCEGRVDSVDLSMLQENVQKSTKLRHGASKGWKGHNEDRAMAPVFGASAPRAGPARVLSDYKYWFYKKQY